MLHTHYSPISYQHGINDTLRILFSEGLCRVAVPIFFLISGYLFFVRLEEWNTAVWREKLKNRVNTLLIPYLIWNLISLLYLLGRSYLAFVLLNIGDDFDIAAGYHAFGGLRAFWDSGTGGLPNNYPLWFIRDLMVFVTLAPVIHHYVRKTGIAGLILLYTAYLIQLWKVPGLSLEGLFFFSFGAFLSIRKMDFADFFQTRRIAAACIAVPLVLIMVLAYGNNDAAWGYARRLFTPFGASCTIGMAAWLIQRQRMSIHPFLSQSTFFVFAAHGTIVLPLIYTTLGKILPSSQIGLVIRYFTAPLLTVAVLVISYYYLSKWMPKTLYFLTGRKTD